MSIDDTHTFNYYEQNEFLLIKKYGVRYYVLISRILDSYLSETGITDIIIDMISIIDTSYETQRNFYSSEFPWGWEYTL